MKARILSLAAIVFATSLIFTSCQKDSSESNDYTSETATHSEDQNRFSSEVDAVANDANGFGWFEEGGGVRVRGGHLCAFLNSI